MFLITLKKNFSNNNVRKCSHNWQILLTVARFTMHNLCQLLQRVINNGILIFFGTWTEIFLIFPTKTFVRHTTDRGKSLSCFPFRPSFLIDLVALPNFLIWPCWSSCILHLLAWSLICGCSWLGCTWPGQKVITQFKNLVKHFVKIFSCIW